MKFSGLILCYKKNRLTWFFQLIVIQVIKCKTLDSIIFNHEALRLYSFRKESNTNMNIDLSEKLIYFYMMKNLICSSPLQMFMKHPLYVK